MTFSTRTLLLLTLIVACVVSAFLAIAASLSTPREYGPIGEVGIEYLSECRITIAWINLPDGSQLSIDSDEELDRFRALTKTLAPFKVEKLNENDSLPKFGYMLGQSGSGNSPSTIEIAIVDSQLTFYFPDGGHIYYNGNGKKFLMLLEELKDSKAMLPDDSNNRGITKR